MIVPAPAGGTLDLVARAISDDLASALGQTVVVESKPGGAGMIGVQELLTSPHDGHTVMVHISGIVSEIPSVSWVVNVPGQARAHSNALSSERLRLKV